MKQIFADLHIHIGRTQTGKPVKITGSKHLTIESILEEASNRKGIEMVGVIDCHVPEVIAELKHMLRQGMAQECLGGGIRYAETTLILGTEMELYDKNCRGPLHVLCFFPSLDEMSAFSCWMSTKQKNIHLSSQRSYASALECQQKVKELNGLFIPAHIFTPFKSLYGKGVKSSLREVLDPSLIDAMELGLSSDTSMADQLAELHDYTFVSNSDAHSVSKLAREYQQLAVRAADFENLRIALKGTDKDIQIVANYGLDPQLGKYHREVSARLEKLKRCSQHKEIGERPRPPYFHQIPLEYIPNLGPKTYERLLLKFGTEMNVLHRASIDELSTWVKDDVASMIIAAREGRLKIRTGGAGTYGTVYKSM